MSYPSPTEPGLVGLARAARWTGIRLRMGDAIGKGFSLLPIPIVYAIAALTYMKLAQPGPKLEAFLCWAGLALLLLPLGRSLYACFRRQPRYFGAMALDRHHGYRDRISNALAFGDLPASQRTPFMQAAMQDAVVTARSLKPRRAAPLHVPLELPVVAVLVALLGGLALLEVRTQRMVAPGRHLTPLVLAPDDLDLLKETAQQLAQQNQDPETLAALQRFNGLIEDIAQKRLDRSDVFGTLQQIERDLNRAGESEREALDEGLKALARELEKSALSKPLREPLESKKLDDAQRAMRELAEKLRRNKPPSKAELEQLRQALQKASQASSERLKQLEKMREELSQQRRLLQRKEQRSSDKQRQLEKLDRQLQRLDRQKQRSELAARQLSELDRQLASAAEKLFQELGLSAQDLERAAQDLNRLAEKQQSEQEKQKLLKQIEELRQLLRQQGQGGSQQMTRLLLFGQHARGEKGQGSQGKKGQPGKGQGQGQQGELPALGLGLSRGAGSMGGAEMPGAGVQGSPPKAGQGGPSAPDKGWGAGHDPNVKGEKSGTQAKTKDVSAAAVDTGEGSASSEVIYGAAQRGFVGRGYQKVYTDYKNVAERGMGQDQIPPGYRFYVQRYFQLIRPRE
ncbi:MAG TPA: hypothetical protein VGJ84_16525 [Polyangiaceae bacterium]